jgi:hypothetical protein
MSRRRCSLTGVTLGLALPRIHLPLGPVNSGIAAHQRLHSILFPTLRKAVAVRLPQQLVQGDAKVRRGFPEFRTGIY